MTTIDFEYGIGDKVEIATVKDIYGHVIGMTLNRNGITYHVCWWADGKRFDEWLCDFELKPA